VELHGLFKASGSELTGEFPAFGQRPLTAAYARLNHPQIPEGMGIGFFAVRLAGTWDNRFTNARSGHSEPISADETI